jgi:nucleoside-diphosphate-sugar epimerase
MKNASDYTVLVTGAGGFLGRAIVDRCLARGWKVRGIARGAYPDLAGRGVEMFRGDIGVADELDPAVQGCDAVFHVAALAGVWGAYHKYYEANTLGTRNVIDACVEYGVKKLIYTSTPSVVHGGHNVSGLDESAPYGERFSTHYQSTKAEAEKAVLAENGEELLTVALRPHLIWGPGDNHITPRLIARHKAGRLRLVGGGVNRVDGTYIDNAALAHLLAHDRLERGAACAGRAYFIAQDEPVPSKELINNLVGAAGLPAVTKSISPGAAKVVGAILEAIWTVFRLPGEPPMTRFLAEQLSTDHYYDLSAAKRDLGYVPEVSMEEGLRRLRQWLLTNGVTK